MSTIPFDNTYRRLPEHFHESVRPATVPEPRLIRVNRALAEELRIEPEWLDSKEAIEVLSGNRLPEGSEPIAQAYGGHQFGGWVPRLGDGRAVLLGEVVDRSGRRRDIQLKGSGRTPFSRGGDGKSPIGPVLREYVVSEAMAAIGVPTTRALAAVATGETVFRDESLPGGVFTRVAASHIRVGTFQYFLAQQDSEALATLADYAIDRHYPELKDEESPRLALLTAVAERQADLVAPWMHLGFIHGVMNTDNTSVSGETIDFGPCAFQDEFEAGKVFSSIDQFGRYAWNRQPAIAQWNLARFAETLLPVLDLEKEEAIAAVEEALAVFAPRMQANYYRGFAEKLGLGEPDEDLENWIDATLEMMETHQLDFTLFFRDLVAAGRGDESRLRERVPDAAGIDSWLEEWKKRAGSGGPDLDLMERRNPVRIPRNHRVEQAITAAERGDYDPFHRLVDALAEPYREDERYADLEEPPAPAERVTRTFCGT